jgi:hypothetical protein
MAKNQINLLQSDKSDGPGFAPDDLALTFGPMRLEFSFPC